MIERYLSRSKFILKEELRELLNNVYDLERLCGRISYGNLNARDLIQLKNSVKMLPHIKNILDEIKFDKRLETLEDLYNLLDISINEDSPVSIKEGNIIKKGYNKDLDELKSMSSGGKDFILALEQKEKEKTGIKNLKVGFNKVFGYFIEVPNGQKSLIKDEYNYTRKQTLSNCERYITPELKEKEDLILNAEEKSMAMEYDLFIEIRDKVRTYIPKLQNISNIISEIDVLCSLAVVAEENNYVRPKLVDERNIYIKDARHPVVEKVSQKDYVPNDILMDEKTNILLITGPNMSGKSTYMRTLAIIIIMAQLGSFVPCKEASIPIFDKIFTRIGASDDLVSGESTFMVEMKEANNAVSNATENSLILFDELGRGTATYDGMSLAQSILEYIHDKVKAKTLFSTHYHELTSLEKNLRYLKNVHVSAKEENGTITFLHKIKPGAVDKSYGIHVASLVNLPKEIITRASEILDLYENKKSKKEIYEQTSLSFDFNEEKESEVEKKLLEINPLEITPLEALNILDELKKEVLNKIITERMNVRDTDEYIKNMLGISNEMPKEAVTPVVPPVQVTPEEPVVPASTIANEPKTLDIPVPPQVEKIEDNPNVYAQNKNDFIDINKLNEMKAPVISALEGLNIVENKSDIFDGNTVMVEDKKEKNMIEVPNAKDAEQAPNSINKVKLATAIKLAKDALDSITAAGYNVTMEEVDGLTDYQIIIKVEK